jgi:alpha-tubulin suppressor-like RCC1 family protein
MRKRQYLLGLGLLHLASTFSTPNALGAEAPAVFTMPAWRVTTTSATLRGMVNPRGLPATAWFEWGETTSYGNLTTATNLAGGSNVVYVAAEAEGLMPGRRLHCRLVVSNSLGVFPGVEQVFGIGTRVVCWGVISNAPAGLRRITSVASGQLHNAAVRNDGALIVWGVGGRETAGPAAATNIVAAATDPNPSLTVGLRADGTVTGLGLLAPPPVSNAVAVAVKASGVSSAALLADGRVVFSPASALWFPASVSNFVAISGRASQGLGLRDTGVVVNGYGTNAGPADLTNAVAIAAGSSHALALRADGTVRAWGSNAQGQTEVPAGLSNVVAIACGDYSSLALRSDGTVAGWGRLLNSRPATPPAGLSNVIAIAAGWSQCLAVVAEPLAPYAYTARAAPVTESNAVLNGFVTANGNETTAWFEWGTNTAYGNTTTRSNAGFSERVRWLSQPISGLTVGQVYHGRLVASNQLGVTYGADRRFGVARRVAAWPADLGGQTAAAPRVPAGTSNLVAVSGSRSVDFGVRTDGSVAAWGNSSYGGERTVPANATGVVAIASGFYHAVAARGDGTVVAWGDNTGGQTNVPPGLSNVVAVAAGQGGSGGHSLALRSDGTLARWGSSANPPVAVGDAVAIACANLVAFALNCDGTVAGWEWGTGMLTYGAPIPQEVTNVVTLASGDGHALAIRSDGRLFVWGFNEAGQTNLPLSLTNAVDVAGGFAHSVALTADDQVVGWGNGLTVMPPGLVGVIGLASGHSHNVATSANTPPTVSSITNTIYVNTSRAMNLRGFDPNGDALRFRIVSLPTNGTLVGLTITNGYQPITSPDQELLASYGAGFVTYTPAVGGFGSPYDSFGYVATDSEFQSSPALLVLKVLLPPPPTLPAGGGSWTTNGEFALRFTGNFTAAYRVFASTNLMNWEPVGFATHLGSGQFEFREVPPTNRPVRFYRPGAP